MAGKNGSFCASLPNINVQVLVFIKDVLLVIDLVWISTILLFSWMTQYHFAKAWSSYIETFILNSACMYLIIIKFVQLRQQTWVYLVISYPFVKLPMYNHRLSSSALHRNLLESTTDSSPINFSKLQQPSGNASDEQQQLLREKVSKNWRVRKRWRLSQAILFTEGKSNDQWKKASNNRRPKYSHISVHYCIDEFFGFPAN